MRLYLTAKTTMKDLVIDHIDIKLKSGKLVTLTWDESDSCVENGFFTARYKGIYLDDDYGNGRYEELKDMQIVEIGIDSDNDEPTAIAVTNITIEDGEHKLDFDGLLYTNGDS